MTSPPFPAFKPARLVLAGLCLATFIGALAYGRKQGSEVPGEQAYKQGLEVWRATDLNNSSCSFCHSPDGIEIAAYNFSDADIKRRATPHLGAARADLVVDFIHAVRRRYGIKKLLDPMTDRPLQPGGRVLPGSTAQQRDDEFGRSLEPLLPTLIEGNVNSEGAAERARDELLKLDVRRLPIGIPFNRISEDGFHGKEHATFAHWIADTPVTLKFPWNAYFILQDAYLANPTSSSAFFEVERFPKHDQSAYYLSQQMSNSKYRALLIYAHALRLQLLGKDAFEKIGPVLFGDVPSKKLPNPMFELGQFADEHANVPFQDFQFPASTLAKKNEGPTESEQMKQICLPSLWAGWLMDQGLDRMDISPAPRATRLLCERLFSDGPYPMHEALMISKKLVTEAFVPEAWGEDTPQHFSIDYSSFLRDENLKKYEPADPGAKERYRRFVLNSLKMSLYLYKKQLAASTGNFKDSESAEEIPQIEAYVKEVDPGSYGQVDALAKEISALTSK